MITSPQKAVEKFKKQYSINKITEQTMVDALNIQGYTVIYFNSNYNEPNIASLIKKLNLKYHILCKKGFTYNNDKYRFVFVNEDLSKQEKLLILAHEEGHIFCNHYTGYPIVGKDVIQEHEANEFAHYLLHPTNLNKLKAILIKYKKLAIISCALTLILAIGITAYSFISTEKSYHGELYITETGKKYHRKNCMFIRDKSNVYRLTEEEFNSGDYAPCKICLPQD